MIRSLRRKFILIAMASPVGTMAVKAIVPRHKSRIFNHYTFTAVVPQISH